VSDLTPHSLDAERAVLGAVLVHNDHLEVARALVQPADFFRTAHQTIYAAMLGLADRGVAVDTLTLSESLGEALEGIGGVLYLSRLIDGMPRAANVAHYADIVRDKAARRKVIQAARKLEAGAHDLDATADALIDQAEAELTTIALKASGAGDLCLGDALRQEVQAFLDEQTARRQRGSGVTGVPSGLPSLDLMLDGFQPGDFVIIGARPSQGKTALGLQLALAAEGPVAFFSLEMGKAQLGARAVSLLAQVNGWSLRRGLLHADEYRRVDRALEALAARGLGIDDTPGLSPWALRSKARRFKVQHGLAMVVIDYVGLMTPPKGKREQNREQDVAAISRSLKALAKELHVPVLALSQLSRDTAKTGKPPSLADLRESGSLEQDSDVVLFIHRPNQATVKDEGPAELLVAKHRNGPTGVVDLWWIPQQTRFREQLEQQGVA
jgi:replicative DNA helicase